LREAAQPWLATGQIQFRGIVPTAAVRGLLVEQDVLIQTSDFEGLSLTLLEGMAAGCVPVVTDLRSGVREVVRDGENGYTIGVGDIDGFADRLALLQRDAELCSRLSNGARKSLVESGYTLDAMADRYLDLFARIAKEIEDGGYQRPAAAVEPLPWMRPSWKDRLPSRLRRGLSRMKGVMR
jgi:glycosyltransferase involved in cell wall biosynthesis